MKAEKHGGIVNPFERLFSVDSVKRHRPAPQVYAHVEKELGALATLCHTCDTLRAVAAGRKVARIKRVGNDVCQSAHSRRSSVMI
jgi:2-haloacid dehalogenase